jgi:SpoVK/Ycf46/Vps4 family AAA+-type ATPase
MAGGSNNQKNGGKEEE